MSLYKANGDPWNPQYEETRVLDDVLRRIVDALRYRRPGLSEDDAYARALARLSEAATDFTTAFRENPAAAGPTPEAWRWAS
jgi:hypothetical protein